MADYKLYFSPGACSRVPLIALNKIGVPFDTELVAFRRGDHRSPDYLALNPAGKIPLLLSYGEPIAQNTAILLWLSDNFPDANLLPPASSAIDRTRNISELVRFSADLHPIVTRIRMPQFLCDIAAGPPRVADMGRAAMSVQLQDYEQLLLKQDWLGGSDWGVLDAYLHWVWFRITGAGFDEASFPAISAFYKRTLELEPVRAALKAEAEAESWLKANDLAIPPPISST